jgi:CheY-like chemotaxis protein
VILNIAANARDAMPNGGTLSISTAEATIDDEFIKTYGGGEPGPYAAISFADTGIGMNATIKQRIFEPFFTTKEIGKGTGLGLSTVYGIIKQHNGNIFVESQPDKGTTFRILLPLTQVESSDGSEMKAAISVQGKETILLIEDEDDVRHYIRLLLEHFGYKVLEASDGEEAINKFAEHRQSIDLAVIDVVMPKMNGKEVYLRLKAAKPDIKALFISGYTHDIIEKKGISGEELNLVQKPVRSTEFLGKIRDLLDKPARKVRRAV